MKNDKKTGQNPAQKNGSLDLPSKETIEAHLQPVSPMPEPLAYDINQTAAALNMCTKSVRRQIIIGRLKPCKALRKILIPRQQVEDFFKKYCDVPNFNA